MSHPWDEPLVLHQYGIDIVLQPSFVLNVTIQVYGALEEVWS